MDSSVLSFSFSTPKQPPYPGHRKPKRAGDRPANVRGPAARPVVGSISLGDLGGPRGLETLLRGGESIGGMVGRRGSRDRQGSTRGREKHFSFVFGCIWIPSPLRLHFPEAPLQHGRVVFGCQHLHVGCWKKDEQRTPRAKGVLFVFFFSLQLIQADTLLQSRRPK